MGSKADSFRLTTPYLRGFGLGEDGGVAVASQMNNTTPTLTELDLTDNRLREVGGVAIAGALESNTTLETLDLGYNDLGDKTGVAVASALERNTTLMTLDLRVNDLGETGVVPVLDALKNNTTLTTLNLCNNGFILWGGIGRAVADVLEINTTLTTLDLSYNYLGEGFGRVIHDVLQRNTSLTYLSFDREDPYYPEIQEILSKRETPIQGPSVKVAIPSIPR